MTLTVAYDTWRLGGMMISARSKLAASRLVSKREQEGRSDEWDAQKAERSLRPRRSRERQRFKSKISRLFRRYLSSLSHISDNPAPGCQVGGARANRMRRDFRDLGNLIFRCFALCFLLLLCCAPCFLNALKPHAAGRHGFAFSAL